MHRIKRDDEKGTFWFVVDVGKKSDGKRNQVKRRGFKRRKDAEKALTDILSSVHRGEYLEPSKMLYKDLISDWLNTRKHSIGEQTYNVQEMYTNNHIIPEFGHTPLSKIKKIHIQNFVNKLNDKGLAPATIKKIHFIIKNSLSYGVNYDLIIKNPADGIILPKMKRVSEISVWTEEEMKRFLSIAKDDNYYIVYLLALTTGMRRGEILGLRWKDVKLDQKTLTVHQTLKTSGKGFLDAPKTAAGRRTISIPNNLAEELKERKKQIEYNIKRIGISYKDHGLVACSLTGTPINPSNLRRNFSKLIKAAKVPRIRFHDLRHTHATLLLAKEVNVKVIAERLGHADTRMTLDTYSHLLPTMQESAVNSLNNIFD